MTKYTLADLNEILEKVDDDTLNEFGRQLREEFELEQKAAAVNRLELFITHRCNLSCSYCFLKGGMVHQGDMPIEVAEKTLRFCVERSKNIDKFFNLILFGGEPLLVIDLMEDILELADRITEEHGKGMEVSCTTNGLLLDERAVEISKKYRFNYLVSIDGTREDHDRYRKTASGEGTYDKILEKIHFLKPYQPWLGARMTIAPETMSHTVEAVKELFEVGINQFLLDTLSVASWQPDQLAQIKDVFYELLEFNLSAKMQGLPLVISYGEFGGLLPDRTGMWGCPAGKASISVTASGDVFGCSRAIRQEHLRMGNIMKGNLDWDIARFFWDQRPELRWKCMHCNMVNSCGGGCPLGNYESMGTPYYPPDICCTVTRALWELKEENPRFAPFFDESNDEETEGAVGAEQPELQPLNAVGQGVTV